MTKSEKRMKQYTNAVSRRLNLPREVKNRVIHDFCSSIQGRREAGQADEDIFAELGSPKKVAAELNDQMKEYAFVKSPWRWAFLALIAGGGIYLVLDGVGSIAAYLLSRSLASSVGIIGGADGPTAIFVTASPLGILGRMLCALLVVLIGTLGFRRLSRCKRK